MIETRAAPIDVEELVHVLVALAGLDLEALQVVEEARRLDIDLMHI